jgi:hypothetical protein
MDLAVPIDFMSVCVFDQFYEPHPIISFIPNINHKLDQLPNTQRARLLGVIGTHISECDKLGLGIYQGPLLF